MIFWPGVLSDRGSRAEAVERAARSSSQIDTPQDRAEAETPNDPPDDLDVHFRCRHASAADEERREAYAGLQDEIQRLCPPGRVPNEESFIDKVHTGHL